MTEEIRKLRDRVSRILLGVIGHDLIGSILFDLDQIKKLSYQAGRECGLKLAIERLNKHHIETGRVLNKAEVIALHERIFDDCLDQRCD